MSLRIIAKTVAIILVVIIAILTLIVLYFFIADIQTKEPKEIDEECEIENNQFMGRKVFTIRNKQKQKGKYILYFHGGSYVAQVTQNHWDFLEKIVTDTGYTVVVPDYPLTPKYNYKDTYNMAIPLYKEIISQIEENEIVEEATIRVSGKVIYVTITFVPATTLVEGQSIALASLDYFSEETLSFYDLEYMIQAEDTEDAEGFQLIGAKNVSGTGGIVWNNNTKFEEEAEEVSEE